MGMSQNISGRAATAREQARRKDGKFGDQPHDKAEGIDLAMDAPAPDEPKVLSGDELLRQYQYMDALFEAPRVSRVMGGLKELGESLADLDDIASIDGEWDPRVGDKGGILLHPRRADGTSSGVKAETWKLIADVTSDLRPRDFARLEEAGFTRGNGRRLDPRALAKIDMDAVKAAERDTVDQVLDERGTEYAPHTYGEWRVASYLDDLEGDELEAAEMDLPAAQMEAARHMREARVECAVAPVEASDDGRTTYAVHYYRTDENALERHVAVTYTPGAYTDVDPYEAMYTAHGDAQVADWDAEAYMDEYDLDPTDGDDVDEAGKAIVAAQKHRDQLRRFWGADRYQAIDDFYAD